MVSGSHAQQSLCNNLLGDPTVKQDKFASPQNLVERLDISNNKALILLEALILPLIPPTKNLFTKFMKAFVEST